MTKESGCKYTSIKVPKVLAERIVNSKIFNQLGYRSVSEFILDAGRLRLEHLEKVYANK